LLRAFMRRFSAAAALLDTTNDLFNTTVAGLAKQKAKQSGVSSSNPGVYNGRPKITPWEIEELDEEMYVCFVGDGAFRSLQADPTMFQANRDARAREGNPPEQPRLRGQRAADKHLVQNIPEITQRLTLNMVGRRARTSNHSSSAVKRQWLCDGPDAAPDHVGGW
jgi:hypothetical protein